MRKLHKWARNPLIMLMACLGVSNVSAAVTGQWDFDSGDLSATVGGDMQYLGAAAAGTEFNTASGFSLPAQTGGDASVMKFPANTIPDGYSIPTPASANGSQTGVPEGTLVNDWTLIVDVLYPTESDATWRAIIETDGRFIAADADFFVNPGNGIGISGQYDGNIAPNTWHRIGLVLDGSAGLMRKYIDGVEVGIMGLPSDPAIGTLDGRWALAVADIAELFNDNDGDVAEGYVSSVQLRDSALNAGQMLAIGGPVATGVPQVIPPVPPYLETRSPAANDSNASPLPTISAVLNQGDQTIVQSSIKLIVDGVDVGATVSPASPFSIEYVVTVPYKPLSDHTVVVEYSTGGAPVTIEWGFSVPNYQNITLPAPEYIETFDLAAEGGIPTGWVRTNFTDTVVAGLDLSNIDSDSYLDWQTITAARLQAFSFGGRRFNQPPIIVNDQIVDPLTTGNLIYAESDQRGGNQVQVIFSPDYDLTGVENVFLVFNSMYEQNQDSSGSVEYSIDGGATWLPVLYMIDQADLIFDGENIDAVATMNEARTDQAYDLSYGTWIGAPITAALAPFISGRVNDDSVESKRVEVHRLPAADNAATVRFRMAQSGTASWYWGIDNFGLYSINTPVINSNPISLTVIPGDSVSFSVSATSPTAETYQWNGPNGALSDGGKISGATTPTLTITGADTAEAGSYFAEVTNQDGTVESGTAVLMVIDVPQFNRQPALSVAASEGTEARLFVEAVGREPLAYQWRKGTYEASAPVSGADGSALSFLPSAAADTGTYFAIVSNASGSVTSVVSSVSISAGAVTDGLVAHLRFDGDYNDASGANNNASAQGSPTFVAGQIGGGSLNVITDESDSQNLVYNYATLGTPAALNFGDSIDFSVAFWIKINSITSDPSYIANKDWGSGSNDGWLIAGDDDGRVQYNIAQRPLGRRDWDSPGGLIGDGGWHHVVSTFDRDGSGTTYVDGALAAERPPSVTPGDRVIVAGDPNPDSIVNDPAFNLNTTTPTNIGQDGTGTYGADFNADMDDVGIWSRVLTGAEVAAIYQAGLAGGDLQTAVVTPTLGSVTIQSSPSGDTVTITYPTGPGIRLETTPVLGPPNWQPVPGSDNVGTIDLPVGSGNEYFRATKPGGN